MSAAEWFRGRVVPAVPALFDAAGVLDAATNRRYAEWMAAQDIGGIAIWAHTGRGLHLTDDQRAELLAVWMAAYEGPIICGVGVPAATELPSASAARTAAVTEAVVAMARAAKQGGARAVMVHPPTPLKSLDDVESRVVAVHEAVTEVGLPVLAFYLYGQAGGIRLGADTVEQLLAIDRVFGIKVATLDSVMTFQDLAVAVRRTPNALLVSGEDRFLGYSLMMGAGAALVGIAAAGTDVVTSLLRAWFQDHRDEFLRMSARVDMFARATFRDPMEGYVQRMVWALEADGVIPQTGRDPFGPTLGSDDRDRVISAIRRLRVE